MREKFIEIGFKPKTLKIIEQANAILVEYEKRNLKMTLRQLYYQFVARNILPNKQSQYKRLGDILKNARLAGLTDWALMEDRLRNLEKLSVWRGPLSILRAVEEQYREDWWAEQDYYCEVWIEKDALVGTIENVCESFRVPYFACRGHVSESEMYLAGKRFARMAGQGKRLVMFHLGDHDPSGLQMTEDNAARLSMLAGRNIEVRRLAMTYNQIEQYDPPSNPAKESDSRFDGYRDMMMEDHGYADPDDIPSWELDALDPTVLETLISDAVGELLDWARWGASQKTEEENRIGLTGTADHWDRVLLFLKHREADVPEIAYDHPTFDDLLDEIAARDEQG